MQPGNPGQDPYGQQPPSDPTSQPYQNPYPTSGQPTPGQPAYGQPGAAYPDPYAQQPPTSGQPYGAAPGYPAAGQTPNNTLGLIALIVGIAAIPLAICCSWVGILPGIAAIVLGVLGRGKANRGEATNGGQAFAGLICGIVGIVIAVIWIVLAVTLNLGVNLFSS